MADTSYRFPASTPDPGTDNLWATPTNVMAEDGAFATVLSDPSLTLPQSYGTFSFSIPSSATILGIEVRLKGKAPGVSIDTLITNLSGTFTASKSQNLTSTNTSYVLGSSTDLWGRSRNKWSVADFSDANFILKIQPSIKSGAVLYSVDSLEVRIHYSSSSLVQDYGLKIAQLGFDVDVASDQELLFSSSWPLLKIDYTATATFNSSVASVIYTHDLGYPPFFVAFKVSGGNSYLFNSPLFYCNNTQLGQDGTGANESVTIKFYVCRLNLKTAFSAPLIRTEATTQGAIDSNYGFKVSKAGKDFSSTDLRDFTVHSSTRSPLIHRVTTGQLTGSGTDFSLNYTNDLGYAPIFFAYHSTDNTTFTVLIGGEQAPPKLLVNPTSGNISITNTSGSFGTIIVFKDPFVFPTITEVSV